MIGNSEEGEGKGWPDVNGDDDGDTTEENEGEERSLLGSLRRVV